MKAGKYDVEIEKIRSSTERWTSTLQLASNLGGYASAVFAIWIIMDSLKTFFLSDPDVINAMTGLIDKINPSNITGYFLAGIATIAWRVERSGKKRAIKEKGKFQAMAEKHDKSRSSSGLSSTGDSPENEK